jgi:hypothetical protein
MLTSTAENIKKLTTVRPISDEYSGKGKYCMLCDSLSTREIFFDVDNLGIILLERYCDLHASEVQ